MKRIRKTVGHIDRPAGRSIRIILGINIKHSFVAGFYGDRCLRLIEHNAVAAVGQPKFERACVVR